MNVLNRLRLIFDSDYGQLLVVLFGALLLLVLVYLFFLRRQKARDALAYYHQSHYEKANGLMREFLFVGKPQADFFGRQTVVKYQDGSHVLALVPPPDLSSEGVCTRFRFYHRALKHHPLPLFSRYPWTYDEEMLIVVQDQLIKKEGRLLPSLSEFLLDTRFGPADAELILLEISRALAALHDLTTEDGEHLYHGFLLPRTIFLGLDGKRHIDRIVIADHGLAFAFGAEKIAHRLRGLSEKKIFVEPYCAKTVLDEHVMLAPEQRDPQRFGEIGACSDFFAFGALAVTLLTKRPFSTVKDIAWADIPMKWRSFLKSCLEEETVQRPKDFLQLQDYLYDPDLALTHHESVVDSDDDFVEEEEEKPMSLDALAGVLKESQSFRTQQLAAGKGLNPEELQRFLDLGKKALSKNKWALAKKHFVKAHAMSSENPEVNVALAIIHYEQGKVYIAQQYYEKAKQHNEEVAKRFRAHIAFRI